MTNPLTVNITRMWIKFIRKKSWLFSLAGVVLIAGIAVSLTILFHWQSDERSQFITAIAAVLMSLWGGVAFGVIFTLAMGLAIDYLAIPEVGKVLSGEEDVRFLIITLISVITGMLVATLRISLRETDRLRQEAERAIEARDLFISVISHELKNPLTAISTSIQLANKTISEIHTVPKLQKMLENIRSSVYRMTRLVSNLLDASKIDSKRLALNLTPTFVKDLIGKTIEIYAAEAAIKSIHLSYQIAPDCPEVIICDQDRILQALSNLIGNAIKFTTQGSVAVHVMTVDHSIDFQVKDTGPGIEATQIPNIFDRFWQAKETAYQGTGLGLYITRGLAEAHGGVVRVDSQLGMGSTFHLTLPIVQASRSAVAKPDYYKAAIF